VDYLKNEENHIYLEESFLRIEDNSSQYSFTHFIMIFCVVIAVCTVYAYQDKSPSRALMEIPQEDIVKQVPLNETKNTTEIDKNATAVVKV
jgi:hypothetical protein